MDPSRCYNDPTRQGPTWIMTDRSGKYVYLVELQSEITVSEYASIMYRFLSQLNGSVPSRLAVRPAVGLN